MVPRSDSVAGRAVALLVLALSIVIGIAVIQPFTDAPVGFDTQATVAYWERIAAGTRLEQALSTTPKPLLTVVYGMLHALTGDWRPIVWASVVALAAAAALAAVLATRAAGVAAGAAAGIAVAGTPLLIEDAAFGNAVPWALLGWFVAALLLTSARPRPVAAGVALGLAALCRLETLVIVAVMGLALAWAQLGPWPRPGPRPAPHARTWLAVVIPFAALPVMLVHDLLLTGDPFFWVGVSERYSAAVRESGTVLGPIERIGWLVRRYVRMWPVVALAVGGIIVLVRGRRWPEIVGLAGMGPGIAAFLVLLAARGLYAPDRYSIPIDVALVLLAAVGLGSLATLAAGPLARIPFGRTGALAAAVGLGLAAAIGTGSGPFDPGLARVVGDSRTLNENAARVLPALRETVDGSLPGSGVGWFVPTPVRPRIAVELDVPLTSVGGLAVRALDPTATPFAPGQRVFHDLRGDVPRGAYALLEQADEVRIGALVLRPLLVDETRGIWLHEVIAAP